MGEHVPDSKDLKGRAQRGWEIVALVAAVIGVVVAGVFGKMQAVPAFRDAVSREKEALDKLVKAREKRKTELGGKKAPDGPEVKSAEDDFGQARERKSSAMITVAGAATGGLALGLWGFLAGLVGLLKAKYRGGRFFKTLGKRVFAVLALVVGFVSLYLSVGLLWAIS